MQRAVWNVPSSTWDTDKFDCPVCYTCLLPPIFQCKNGHLLSKECIKKLKTCPVWRAHGYPQDITCDECNETITGLLFMCRECVYYDLCQRCYLGRRVHTHHLFVSAQSPVVDNLSRNSTFWQGGNDDSQPLGCIANLWPNLQSLRCEAFGINKFEEQVFGLHQKELELLCQEDKAFLKCAQLPQRRPCVATLKKLEHLKLVYQPCKMHWEDPARAETFLKLVKSLFVDRKSDLNFKMEPLLYPLKNYWDDMPRFG